MSFHYFKAAGHATSYNKFRHSPPKDLVKKIVDYIKEKVASPLQTAVDVGCGGGQSTLILSPYFQKVTGLDPSKTQVEDANKRNKPYNVSFRVGSAEDTGLASRSVQLVTASQSCHWFNLPKFYTETARVLEPGGVLAMYGYRLPQPTYCQLDHTQHLSDIVLKYYSEVLSDYSLPQSKKAYLGGYKDEEFNDIPFTEEPLVRDDSINVEFPATLADLIGYMSTWSSFQNYRQHEGEEKSLQVLKSFEGEMMAAIGCQKIPEEIKLNIKYCYFLIMGRKPLKK